MKFVSVNVLKKKLKQNVESFYISNIIQRNHRRGRSSSFGMKQSFIPRDVSLSTISMPDMELRFQSISWSLHTAVHLTSGTAFLIVTSQIGRGPKYHHFLVRYE